MYDEKKKLGFVEYLVFSIIVIIMVSTTIWTVYSSGFENGEKHEQCMDTCTALISPTIKESIHGTYDRNITSCTKTCMGLTNPEFDKNYMENWHNWWCTYSKDAWQESDCDFEKVKKELGLK